MGLMGCGGFEAIGLPHAKPRAQAEAEKEQERQRQNGLRSGDNLQRRGKLTQETGFEIGAREAEEGEEVAEAEGCGCSEGSFLREVELKRRIENGSAEEPDEAEANCRSLDGIAVVREPAINEIREALDR